MGNHTDYTDIQKNCRINSDMQRNCRINSQNNNRINRKVYVKVNADFTAEGQLIPRTIIWRDGNRFDIDKVLMCSRRASLKAGGIGMRYTCIIRGQQHYLFYEDNYKWFVEVV